MERPDVIFDDLELWLCGYLRSHLADPVYVANRQVSGDLPAVLVRDDSGLDQQVTAERRVAIRVIDTDALRASNLARTVARLVRTCASTDPVSPAACLSVYGPARVEPDSHDLTEHLLTAELVVLGHAPEEP